ncbi:MAG: AsmA family protein, partial [Nevskiales bacterium]
MGKLAKVLLIVVGLAVAGIVALAVLLPLYFDPNDFKDEIAAAAKDKTGRDLTISGDIGLTVFPWLGVELGQTSMSNAAGFGDKPFAEFDQAVVRLQLMPLLRGDIEVGRVILNKLRLRLAKNAQGVNNWQDIQAELAKDDEVEAAEEAKDEVEEDSGFQVKSLQVAGVEVNDAAIYWDDAQAGASYKFEDVNLETGTLIPGEPAPVTLDLVVGLAEPNVTGQVHAEAQINVDVEKEQYAANGLILELVAIGEGVPNGKQSIKLTADASADLVAQTLSLPNLVVNAAGGELTGSLTGKQIVDNPVLSGALKANNLSPRDILKTLGQDVPETADGNVLNNASLDVKFNGPLDNLQIKPLVAKLDDTNINGSASLTRNSPLVVGFDLNVDSLNLDRYLPPSEKPKQQSGDVAVSQAPPSEGKVKSDAGNKSDINDTEIPVDVLKTLNMDGQLKVKQLTVKGMKMNNVALDVESRNGRLEIKPLDAALYQGNADIRAVINANGTPAYALKTSIKSVQSGELLKDLLGHDKLSGLANVALDLTSKGNTVGAMRQSLNGGVNVEFLEGKIKGFNLGQMLRAAKARLKGEPAPPAEPQVTDFATLTLDGHITNGVMTRSDLNFKSPLFRVIGQGKLDLVREGIDYLARISVVDTLKGQGGADLADLKGITIPIRLTGNLFSPSYKLDIGTALQDKAKAELDALKAEKQAELEA